jgi:hypothetical protein
MYSQAMSGLGGLGFQNAMDMGMGLTSQATQQSFNQPGAMQAYMSPYQQGVVEQQKQEAIRDYQKQQPGQSAAAFQAGAGRGTRSALLQAEGQRNLQNQLGDIQAKGSQSAYEQAQRQFNEEQQRRLTGAAQMFGQGSDIYGKQYQAGSAERQQQTDAYNNAMNQFNTEQNRRMGIGQQLYGMGTDIYGRNIAGGEAQRQQKQAELSAMYEDFQKETGMSKENANYMMQLLGQVPQYQDYSTKAYQTAAPNDPNAAYTNALGALGTYAGGGANSGSSATGYGNILSGIMNALGGGSSGSSETNSSGTDIISKLKQLFGGG